MKKSFGWWRRSKWYRNIYYDIILLNLFFMCDFCWFFLDEDDDEDFVPDDASEDRDRLVKCFCESIQ